MTLRYTLLAALLLASPSIALAKDPPPASPLISALETCRAEADDTRRLACFDRASSALVTATRSGDVSVVDRAQLRQARRSLFGFSMPKLPFFAGDKSADEASESLESSIKSARGLGYGRFQLTIADGNAVWETTESFATMREPRAGDKVQIKRGPLGSYLLKVAGQRGVKAKRVG